ncbi:MAG: TolC family protein [Lentimicrobiaceae bacterium]|jgi:outer membrane protein
MNTGSKVIIILSVTLLFVAPAVIGQQATKEWTLRNCIDYALQNNIQIKQLQVGVKVNEANLEQSKAALYPTLNASASQDLTNKKSLQGNSIGSNLSFTGNYSLQSNVTLYNGLKLKNGIAQQDLNVKTAGLQVAVTQNNIELAVTTAYLQVLYARESVNNAVNTLSASQAQVDQAKIQYDAGYIAESNYAQIQAQYSSDSYALVIARNNLSQQILNLKQLLELDISQELDVYFPQLTDSAVLLPIPSKLDVYKTALNFMPEIESGQLSVNSSELDIEIAKAGLLPSLSLGASTATGYNNAISNGFATQLGDNLYQNVGLNLSIPIFNNKQVKTNISKAKLGLETAQLNYAATQKDLQSRIESAYLDAVSGQSRFQSAVEQLKSTTISYSLVQDQFKLGMKNTVDLLTEKIKYLAAEEEYLQAKYSAILNYKLLDFYQQKKIDL